MNILAFQSSGDQTSVSIMLDDEINSFNYKHNRKDRPNWNMFLENIGLNNAFALEDVDLFDTGCTDYRFNYCTELYFCFSLLDIDNNNNSNSVNNLSIVICGQDVEVHARQVTSC